MQEEVTQKTIALSVKVGKGAARLTEQALQKAIQEVFGAEKQTPAWETDHAAAYEAKCGGFQHRDHRQQYQSL